MEANDIKTWLGLFAMALTLVAFWPYLRSVLNKTIQPHLFTWIIWSLTTCIVFLAQLAGGGGIGAWVIGFSGLLSAFIALLAWKQHEDNTYTQLDKWLFTLSVLSLPVWFFTQDPLWAVIILTSVDLVGFGLTFKKAFYHPSSENLLFYLLMIIRNVMVLYALSNLNWVTALFPAATGLLAIAFVAMVYVRRQQDNPIKY